MVISTCSIVKPHNVKGNARRESAQNINTYNCVSIPVSTQDRGEQGWIQEVLCSPFMGVVCSQEWWKMRAADTEGAIARKDECNTSINFYIN